MIPKIIPYLINSKKSGLSRLVLNLLDFGANCLSQILKILHSFSNSGSCCAIALVIKFVSITFQ